MQRRIIRNMLSGILIGIGSILPGISGGVMAVSFGLYRPMVDAILHFFRDPKKHLRFLTPLAIGIGTGMLLGATLLAALMERYRELMLFLFTGFILGGVPDLLKEAEQNSSFRPAWLVSMLGGIALALPLVLVSSQETDVSHLTSMQALLTGMLEGVGTVVPGISTSFVLLHLGWYGAYLRAVSGMAMKEAFFIAAGFGASALLCMRMVQWLFGRWPGHACYAVLGFLAVSVALVFPGFGDHFVSGSALLLAGAAAARWMAAIEN